VTSARPTPPPVTGEIRSLTGLRVIAATWVVVFHFAFTPGDAYSDLWKPLQPVIRTGALGVDLFYVLSGFVITLTYLDKMGRRPSARQSVAFWWARICRIWPVYAAVTTLFGAWLLYKGSRVTDGFVAYQTQQPDVDVWHYLQQLLMVQLWGRSSFDGLVDQRRVAGLRLLPPRRPAAVASPERASCVDRSAGHRSDGALRPDVLHDR
jgi:peptidoglycan/LPS O-acetylase OafA/YrhL